MRKLSKEMLAKRDKLREEVSSAAEELEGAVATFNDAVAEAFGEVMSAQESLNEALQQVRDFASEVAGEIEAYMSDKSDKWQESENGERYAAWLEAWQDFSPDDEDICQPDSIEALGAGEDAANGLDELPEEPEC